MKEMGIHLKSLQIYTQNISCKRLFFPQQKFCLGKTEDSKNSSLFRFFLTQKKTTITFINDRYSLCMSLYVSKL